jgi:hypothetical protein
MHTGINYYYFNDAINTLAANGFSKSSSALNQGKINTQWQELLTVSQYQNFTSAYMGTVVGAWCYLWCYCSVCLYVPNAELALMFIPVPIKAKYFTRFSFSRF